MPRDTSDIGTSSARLSPRILRRDSTLAAVGPRPHRHTADLPVNRCGTDGRCRESQSALSLPADPELAWRRGMADAHLLTSLNLDHPSRARQRLGPARLGRLARAARADPLARRRSAAARWRSQGFASARWPAACSPASAARSPGGRSPAKAICPTRAAGSTKCSNARRWRARRSRARGVGRFVPGQRRAVLDADGRHRPAPSRAGPLMLRALRRPDRLAELSSARAAR